MRYKIYEEFYEKVEKKLNRIGKKCAKHGNPFTFEIVGDEIVEVENEDGYKNYYKFIIVEVEGTAKISDYECVAVLEIHKSGNVIRRINNEINIPTKFLHTENICEHCNSKRKRNELYIIHNVVTDEFKQVGSDCLNLYTHGLNAEYVASYIDGITELEEYDGCVGGGGKYYIPVKDIIGYSSEIIDKMGYFNSNSDLPTKRLLVEILLHGSMQKKIANINEMLRSFNFYNVYFDMVDFDKDETSDKVEEIIKYYLSLKADSEFIHNVQVLLKDGYIEWQNIGFLCYLPEGYNKYIQKEIKKAGQKLVDEKSEYFGEIGKRYKDVNVYDIRILTGWDTQFGFTYLYKIVLDNGNVLIWKSTNWYNDEDLLKVKKIDFSVKEHTEYKDMKQTNVTRCKLLLDK